MGPSPRPLNSMILVRLKEIALNTPIVRPPNFNLDTSFELSEAKMDSGRTLAHRSRTLNLTHEGSTIGEEQLD